MIQKVSDITVEGVAEYIRLGERTDEDDRNIEMMIAAAKAYIRNYTGRTDEEIDNYADFVIVALCLIQDMFDNRTLYVDKSNLNYMVESILNMHSVNLLPTEVA